MPLGVTATSANLRKDANPSAALAPTPTLYQGDQVAQEMITTGTDGLTWWKVRCTYSNPNKGSGSRLGATGWSQAKWYGNV